MSIQPSLFSFNPGTAFSDDEKANILADENVAAKFAWQALIELFAYAKKMPSASSGLQGDYQRIVSTLADDHKTQMAYYLNFIHHHPTIGFRGHLAARFHSSTGDQEANYLYQKAQTLLMTAHLVAHGEIEKARQTLG